MEVIIAILAGVCAIRWPPIPRWWYWDTQSFFPPPPKPGDPRPTESAAKGPSPEPWMLITGVLAGVGGAVAWVVLGDRFGADGALLPPVVLGLLGGAVTGWAVDSIRNLTGSRARS